MAWRCVERAKGPDGREFALYRFDDEFMIRVGGYELMSTRAHGSEEALARLTCAELSAPDRPRVLIGGLGLGYTVAEALRRLPPSAVVEVCELVPAVARWSAGVTGACCGWPLRDPRVRVSIEDVGALLARREGAYHAVMLDVDNGPEALSCAGNAELYSARGLARARRALAPGGVLSVWSAEREESFETLLGSVGFRVKVRRVPARGPGDSVRHTIYLARADVERLAVGMKEDKERRLDLQL